MTPRPPPWLLVAGFVGVAGLAWLADVRPLRLLAAGAFAALALWWARWLDQP